MELPPPPDQTIVSYLDDHWRTVPGVKALIGCPMKPQLLAKSLRRLADDGMIDMMRKDTGSIVRRVGGTGCRPLSIEYYRRKGPPMPADRDILKFVDAEWKTPEEIFRRTNVSYIMRLEDLISTLRRLAKLGKIDQSYSPMARVELYRRHP